MLTVPFFMERPDGSYLKAVRILRLLPGKRITFEAECGGSRLLAKLFVGKAHARHAGRESAGVRALMEAGIPTAALVLEESLPNGDLVATRFITNALSMQATLSETKHLPISHPSVRQFLQPMFSLLGRVHSAGLAHWDIHPGNFLKDTTTTYLIDGDAVETTSCRPLAQDKAISNLGALIAQFPVAWEEDLDQLISFYQQGNPEFTYVAKALNAAIDAARKDRISDYLSKARRECSRFSAKRSVRRFEIVIRAHAEALAPLIARLDECLEEGEQLKQGRTATVARIVQDGHQWVLKRYNIKSLAHAISRAWRPSRAWHAWIEGHRLQALGIATPQPVAIVEERTGPLRGRAWLLTEHVPGSNLRDLLDERRPPPEALGQSLLSLFSSLARMQITHGDLKATNLIWNGARVVMIDLDAMVQHHSKLAHVRAWSRDRARLLRNWPPGSELHQWLDQHLMPA